MVKVWAELGIKNTGFQFYGGPGHVYTVAEGDQIQIFLKSDLFASTVPIHLCM